jgi:sulfate/thiosulfate transport system ATP-binding protein
VVMDNSRIEQIGSPAELYDNPANPFVMGFLGEITRVGDELVRPHDITLRHERQEGSHEAVVTRITLLGFEVRVELMLSGGNTISAQLTRAEADALELATGNVVWLATVGDGVLPSDALTEEPSSEAEEAPAA